MIFLINIVFFSWFKADSENVSYRYCFWLSYSYDNHSNQLFIYPLWFG